ncbi:AAA family ATPase [Bradyrhizobium liaoningense]|uniref:AAA family ATPase n=1 Tax=Bradyrhizobium liaoningense TaxID=43992 RepID=UPI001BA91595|nr:ATP-binding protein [Bradyrhizobium liaoningense]MBR0984667.1 ATP-binding protein [Bradyrhizobium liaoningense]
MLIRFAVENHLSIRDRQELSLVAASIKDTGANIIPADNMELLPAALIYGANASGKSNFIGAFSFLRRVVNSSYSGFEPKSKIARHPFRLDQKSRTLPTKIDIDFILKGTRYHFGFACTADAFVEEWLYAFPLGKKQVWYYRDANKRSFQFGKHLKGSLRTIEKLTRSNSLFLSAAAQNAHEQLTPIFEYLGGFSLSYRIENRASDAGTTFSDGSFDKRILAFLQDADTGVVGHQFEELLKNEAFDQRGFATDLLTILKKYSPQGGELPDSIEEIGDLKKISLGHKAAGKRTEFFDLSLESAGTLRLLVLLRPVFEALDTGSLVVIDELDASLHTYICEKIVALFNSRKTNPRGAQLIATTHDTNLLSAACVRRDQVWFVEKDNAGASTLYPLTDIRTRGTENLEKGYLQGRFGAIPFRGDLTSLLSRSR